jgi:hypothetical protein
MHGHCFQPYDDVPGIQGVDDCLPSGPQWASIDPELEVLALQHFQYSEDYSTAAHMWNMQQRLTSFQQAVDGYGRLSPLQIPEEQLARLGLQSPWTGNQPDVFRHMRTLSPGCAFGAAYSATDSINSDEALSPDVRRYPSLSSNAYYSPAAECSFTTTGGGSWMAQPLYTNNLASSPYTASEHACNLKDLQYSQDVDVEEEQRPAAQPHLHQPEELAFEDEGVGRSIGDEDSIKMESEDEMEQEDEDVDSDYSPGHKRKASYSAISRGTGARSSPRRPRSLQATTSSIIDTGARISKPGHAHRRTASSTNCQNGTTTPAGNGKRSAKSFPCTFSAYGCPSVFGSKNEWKRHVSSQHLQLGFWRCDTGLCNPNAVGGSKVYNDFNRKDLFTQHHRRMHLPSSTVKWENATEKQRREFESGMDEVRVRCWVVKREKPGRSGCVVRGCGKEFGDWEERMEHIGKHFERGESEEVVEDELLTKWAVAEQLVADLGARGKWLVGMEPQEGNARMGRRGRRSTLEQRDN